MKDHCCGIFNPGLIMKNNQSKPKGRHYVKFLVCVLQNIIFTKHIEWLNNLLCQKGCMKI